VQRIRAKRVSLTLVLALETKEGTKKMFIYADESGHSGRHIFNEPSYYFQGAIISDIDPEPLLYPLAEKYRQELCVERLHANELKPHIVERIAASFLLLLDKANLVFHLTRIEKPYLAVTKFVDSLFDSYENQAVPWLWYNHELFRHTLCCLFDTILPEQKKREFWGAYLKDDYDGIVSIVKWIIDILDSFELDRRLEEVVRSGLSFALKYPEEITLMASSTRKSYKGHTPNMVAFSSLIYAIHDFCKENNLVPEAFVHDPQSEFGPMMKEYHEMLSKVRAVPNSTGLPAMPENVDYDLGKFSLTPSKHLMSLQAVDLFIWLSQRADRIKSPGLVRSLRDKTDPFYISRSTSEMIVFAWHYKLSNTSLTEEQIREATEMIAEMNRLQKKKLRDFESEKYK